MIDGYYLVVYTVAAVLSFFTFTVYDLVDSRKDPTRSNPWAVFLMGVVWPLAWLAILKEGFEDAIE